MSAEGRAFWAVKETCPFVDQAARNAVKDIVDAVNSHLYDVERQVESGDKYDQIQSLNYVSRVIESQVDDIIEKMVSTVKNQTGALREGMISAYDDAIRAEDQVQSLEEQIEELKDRIHDLEAELREKGY